MLLKPLGAIPSARLIPAPGGVGVRGGYRSGVSRLRGIPPGPRVCVARLAMALGLRLAVGFQAQGVTPSSACLVARRALLRCSYTGLAVFALFG